VVVVYFKALFTLSQRCRGSSLGIVTRLGNQGSIPGMDTDFFSSPPRKDRLWGPHSILSSKYRE